MAVELRAAGLHGPAVYYPARCLIKAPTCSAAGLAQLGAVVDGGVGLDQSRVEVVLADQQTEAITQRLVAIAVGWLCCVNRFFLTRWRGQRFGKGPLVKVEGDWWIVRGPPHHAAMMQNDCSCVPW